MCCRAWSGHKQRWLPERTAQHIEGPWGQTKVSLTTKHGLVERLILCCIWGLISEASGAFKSKELTAAEK